MLRVYHSNRLDVLEALMGFIVERQRLDDRSAGSVTRSCPGSHRRSVPADPDL